MTHPTEAELVAHLDGELPQESETEIALHVASCIGCRTRIAEIEDAAGAFAGALQLIDISEPQRWELPGNARAIRAPRRHEAPARPSTRAGRRTVPGSLRWAAGIAIVAVAGLSASVVTMPRGTGDAPEVPQPPVTFAAPPVMAPAAVAVLPRNGSVRVQLDPRGTSPQVVVRLADRADVRVSVGGVEAPQFVAREGEVSVRFDAETASVEIDFPRSISQGSVWNGRTLVARVESGRIVPGDQSRATMTAGDLVWRP